MILHSASDITQTATDSLNSIMDASIGGFTFEKFISTAILIIVCLIVRRILIHLIGGFFKRLAIDRTLWNFLMSAIKGILLFTVVVIVAESLGIPSSSLIAIFSVFGQDISLAVQGFLSNLAGGLMILVSKPFSVGDFIDVASYTGTVTQTSLIYTHLLTSDHKVIYIPNSEISASKIINYTRQTERRIEIFVTASYDSPIADVKNAIQEVLDRLPDILKDPAPEVHVSAYQDSSIQYVVRGWAPTDSYWNAYYDLLEGIKDAFDRHDIEMNYPHLNVHMVKDTDIPVQAMKESSNFISAADNPKTILSKDS